MSIFSSQRNRGSAVLASLILAAASGIAGVILTAFGTDSVQPLAQVDNHAMVAAGEAGVPAQTQTQTQCYAGRVTKKVDQKGKSSDSKDTQCFKYTGKVKGTLWNSSKSLGGCVYLKDYKKIKDASPSENIPLPLMDDNCKPTGETVEVMGGSISGIASAGGQDCLAARENACETDVCEQPPTPGGSNIAPDPVCKKNNCTADQQANNQCGIMGTGAQATPSGCPDGSIGAVDPGSNGQTASCYGQNKNGTPNLKDPWGAPDGADCANQPKDYCASGTCGSNGVCIDPANTKAVDCASGGTAVGCGDIFGNSSASPCAPGMTRSDSGGTSSCVPDPNNAANPAPGTTDGTCGVCNGTCSKGVCSAATPPPGGTNTGGGNNTGGNNSGANNGQSSGQPSGQSGGSTGGLPQSSQPQSSQPQTTQSNPLGCQLGGMIGTMITGNTGQAQMQCAQDQNTYTQQQQQYQNAQYQYQNCQQQARYAQQNGQCPQQCTIPQIPPNPCYNNQQSSPYGRGNDGQPCQQPPQQPDPSQCTNGTFRPLSASGNGCLTGWQCVPNSCNPAPQRPDQSGCTTGTWNPIYSGNTNSTIIDNGSGTMQGCIVGWQCVAGSTGTGPQASLQCSPTVADVGTAIAFTYACTNSTASTGSGFSTNNLMSGTATSTLAAPPTGTNQATYTLACSDGNTSAGASCTVQVSTPKIVLVANPASVASGDFTSIGWTTSGMRACVISSPQDTAFASLNVNNTSINGMATTSAITQKTDYVLTCTTLGGATKIATTTVTIAATSANAFIKMVLHFLSLV